jgi:uncharacterized protein
MEKRPFNDHSYELFLEEEKIMGTRCKKCGASALPPRPVCISCHSAEMEWTEFQGAGKLAAFTSIAVAPPAMAKEGFGRNNPYIVGVIELAEGNRIVGRIVGLDAKNPEKITVGIPLKAEFIHPGPESDKATCLAFKP